jgi:hypothetical protein
MATKEGDPMSNVERQRALHEAKADLDKRLLVCSNCGKEGVRSRRPGAICTLCHAENWEPFREGWD